MNEKVRLLFHELADRSPEERGRILAKRRIGPELRAEVESLLGFDSANDQGIAECVSDAAGEVLGSVGGIRPASCGPYRLVRQLGSGRMGTVYLAERTDGEIEQKVAVRRLHRGGEANDRIDAAFRLVRDTKDYPTGQIKSRSEAATTLRARGDHLGDTGKPQRAAEVYEELLDKVMASNSDQRNDLEHATKLLSLYVSLAGLYRRNGQPGRAGALSALHLELWRHWDGKLPGNGFVRRQLDSVSLP
jgi:hypothetical protein